MRSERKTNMNPITRTLNVDNLLLLALQEDISSEDVTTNAVMPEACQGTVQLLCKQDGVIAGMEVFARVFTLLDEKTEIIPYVKDGDEVKKGDLLATVNGDIRVLLSGERTALNYLQRMSGIATYTRSVAKLLEGSKTTLLDTRKTTPNMRIFEKYAVKIGGGQNHRYNLSDGVLLKDNHIELQAVSQKRSRWHAIMLRLCVRLKSSVKTSIWSAKQQMQVPTLSCSTI